MDRCTLLLTVASAEALYDLIDDALPDHTLKLGDDGRIDAIAPAAQALTFRALDKRVDGGRFQKAVQTIAATYRAAPVRDPRIRAAALDRIRDVNRVVAIVTAPPGAPFEETIFRDICRMGYRGNGLFIFPSGGLYTGRGDLILDPDGKSDLGETDPFLDATRSGGDTRLEQQARKHRSNTVLAAHDIPPDPALPPMPGVAEVRVQTADALLKRFFALLTTSLYAAFARDETVETARKRIVEPIFPAEQAGPPPDEPPLGVPGGWEFLSTSELDFLAAASLRSHQTAPFIARTEACRVALWSLGFLDTLAFPNRRAAPRDLARFVGGFPSLAAFAGRARLRPGAEILDQADITYRFHWACSQAAQNAKAPPGGLDAIAVRERYRMFLWILRDRDRTWDEISRTL